MEGCFNKYLGTEIKLNEGEEFCPECEGTGMEVDDNKPFLSCCNKCLGKGTLDWIEQVIGVYPKNPVLDINSKFLDEWTKDAAEALARLMDDEIMGAILNGEKEKKVGNIGIFWG